MFGPQPVFVKRTGLFKAVANANILLISETFLVSKLTGRWKARDVAWDCRLLPRRVAVVRALYPDDERRPQAHEAELGEPSKFGYGAERMGSGPQQRVAPDWRGHGCAQPDLGKAAIARARRGGAGRMTVAKREALVSADVWKGL
jgi:GNAT superfamily N-acetyltransferase